MEVANIDYSEGTAGINKDQATKNVKAGETYWTVEFADSEGIADLAELTQFDSDQYGTLFNLNRNINKELRERNKLEHEYVLMGYSASKNIKEMAKNRQEYFKSLQDEAALLKSQETELYKEAKETTVVDTTGAGDSLLAGFIGGLELGYDINKSLDLGLACATATVGNVGLGDIGQINKLLNTDIPEEHL
mgnify:CR=1 FL=1